MIQAQLAARVVELDVPTGVNLEQIVEALISGTTWPREKDTGWYINPRHIRAIRDTERERD